MAATTKIRPLPPEVREKLGKLLPLLSSPHDGERIGALAAIERVLEAGGFDWFDFTGAVTGAATTPPPPPPPHGSDRTVSGADMRILIETLRARRRFNARSESFLDDMMARADSYSRVFVGKNSGPGWAISRARLE